MGNGSLFFFFQFFSHFFPNHFDLCFYITRSIATHRGHIKKIKFAPGRGNFKLGVLFSDGVDIWDLQKVIYVFLLAHCK